jgi:ABC-type transport system involved in multi-copper enzyme maturation permease subunit
MMTQTLAIFYDSYRRLNARKIFWIVLLLSVLVVASIGCVGFGPEGISILGWHVSSEPNSDLISPPVFYKLFLFQKVGIDFWLSWVACILAVISTAGIFPDFLSSGSIDLALSKPIGRARLFLTQYAAGLLFVTIQVTLFSLVSYVVIGARAGSWDASVFMAVPLVVCFFSYLFSVCALLGVLTRSTLTALLVTLLFWFILFSLHSVETVVGATAIVTEQGVEKLERKIAEHKTEPTSQPDQAQTAPARDEPTGNMHGRDSEEFGDDLPAMEQSLTGMRGEIESMRKAQRILVRIKTFLPKTAETVQLLQRCLIDADTLPMDDNNEIGRRIVAEQEERSVAWIVGTSLCFEAVMLALGVWVFRRRDF